ncbi:hypothetical protein FBU30_005671 [Linnemannia zychae]|nr:hypothetical protein FBU30_005671 [Linnemannia zychae]
MKRLTLTLVPDSNDTTGQGHYLPGDTFGGHVNLLLSSSMKYTCLRVQFTGLVTTKVAKTEEQVYVLKQQVVLLGQANNAKDHTLEKGLHSWPFQFTIPLQHIPSSGKYRHGTVKYTLTATMTSAGFMGGVQELKASQDIQLRDLINIRVAPYSEPVVITGSTSIKPGSRKQKDMAVATVRLPRAAYLRGQVVEIEIDLQHPNKISRNPGCYVQLVCRQNFYSGDHAKEYQDTLVHKSEPLVVSSSANTGKILAEVTIPDTALPTMNTTKIISVEYHLYLLMDMRPKTGLFERSVKGKVTKKLKTRLLGSPGGLQIEVPLVIGTLSDSLHIQKPSPFAQIDEASQKSGSVTPTRGQSASSSPTFTSSASVVPIVVSPPPPLLQQQQQQQQPQQQPVIQTNPPISELPGYTEEPWPRSNTYTRSRSVENIHVVPMVEPPLPPLPPEAQREALSPPLLYYTRHRGSLPHLSAQRNDINSGSSTSRTYATLRSATAPAPTPPSPPLTPPRVNGSSEPISSLRYTPPPPPPISQRPQPYPPEKMTAPPHQNIPLPINISVEAPTAPRAVDIGIGPASPPISHMQRFPSTLSVASSSKSHESYQDRHQYHIDQHQCRPQQQHQQSSSHSPTSMNYGQHNSHHNQHGGSSSDSQAYFNHNYQHASGPDHGSSKNTNISIVRNPHELPGWTVPPQSIASAPPMNFQPAPLVPLVQVANGSLGSPSNYQLPRPYCRE